MRSISLPLFKLALRIAGTDRHRSRRVQVIRRVSRGRGACRGFLGVALFRIFATWRWRWRAPPGLPGQAIARAALLRICRRRARRRRARLSRLAQRSVFHLEHVVHVVRFLVVVALVGRVVQVGPAVGPDQPHVRCQARVAGAVVLAALEPLEDGAQVHRLLDLGEVVGEHNGVPDLDHRLRKRLCVGLLRELLEQPHVWQQLLHDEFNESGCV
eukprot:COSAG04_NODE_1843_length_5419_cov_7.115226_3_plen_214_part_00